MQIYPAWLLFGGQRGAVCSPGAGSMPNMLSLHGLRRTEWPCLL